MLQRLVGFIAVVVVAGVGVLVWAYNPPATQPTFEPDLPFNAAGGEELKLDLAVPPGDGPFPAVVCLHGGGWVGGDRKQLTRTLGVLSRRGYVAIAPDYRLAPKHRFPACLDDCKAAVAWLRANAAKYHIDPARVGVIGMSAGGHLACMLAVDGGGVQAVVAFSPPCDLTDEGLWTPDALSRNLIPLLGCPPTDDLERYRQASPASRDVKGAPPMLLVVGSEDKTVPPAQAEGFAKKVNRAGGAARLLVMQGEGHTWTGSNLLKSIDEMLTFLDETLGKR
ncbi:MAG: alpha/beta hydrolase [Gemmataceae bacterium]